MCCNDVLFHKPTKHLLSNHSGGQEQLSQRSHELYFLGEVLRKNRHEKIHFGVHFEFFCIFSQSFKPIIQLYIRSYLFL